MKSKGMIIIGGMMLVSLSACDKLTSMAADSLAELETVAAELETVTKKGWEYTVKVDKLTQDHSATATKEFVDEDVDFVRVDVELTCTNSDSLIATITTYDSRANKDGEMSGATMAYDSDKINIVKTRSGKNKINYLIDLPKYNNELTLDVTHPDYKIREEDPRISMMIAMGADPLKPYNVRKESASKMVDNEWVIRVETKRGNPTITVDLDDPKVKKVTRQCKWKPAFSIDKPSENMGSSNEVENGYIQTKATFLGYGESDWGCTSNFIINEEKIDVEGCPKDKVIYENNKGSILTLRYKTGVVEGFKTYYFVDVQE